MVQNREGTINNRANELAIMGLGTFSISKYYRHAAFLAASFYIFKTLLWQNSVSLYVHFLKGNFSSWAVSLHKGGS